jgi:hypothetical protein
LANHGNCKHTLTFTLTPTLVLTLNVLALTPAPYCRFGSTSSWMAILDVDEFMVPAGPYNSLIGLIRDLAPTQTTRANQVDLVASTASTASPDALYFDVSYCAPCRNDSGYTGPDLPSVGGYLGKCQ